MKRLSRLASLTCTGVCAAALVLSLSACSALTAASGGVQTGTSTVGSAQQTGGQVKDLGGQAKDALTGKKKDGDNNGDDDDRLRAKESAINTPLSDSIDVKKGDQYDWRKFQLLGKPGVATFELFWDNEEANLDLDVYDAYGVNIGKNPPRLNGQSVRRILVSIPKPGLYYMRVKGEKDKDKSIYTVDVKWSGPPAPPPQDPNAQQPQNPQQPQQPQPPTVPPGPTAPYSILTDPNKLVGNIISAYRDNGGWVLYLDKGKSQNVRAGQTGAILDGGDGEKLLDKGDFTISQVVDDSKSIARTNLSKPPGKNKRVVINLK